MACWKSFIIVLFVSRISELVKIFLSRMFELANYDGAKVVNLWDMGKRVVGILRMCTTRIADV